MVAILQVFAVLVLCGMGYSFHMAPSGRLHSARHGVRSMTSAFDILAGIALSTQLNLAEMSPRGLAHFPSSSLAVTVSETKQGMYREYTVEKADDSALDEIKRNYKTAEETEDSKNKYWTILAVLVTGSFIIPMVQYYWYVAEED